jgi:hypothetical protein
MAEFGGCTAKTMAQFKKKHSAKLEILISSTKKFHCVGAEECQQKKMIK